MAIRSMTGYARIRRQETDGDITLSIKSVNHRGLDLHFHLPPEFEAYEHVIRGVLRKLVSRGHLDIRATYAKADGGGEAALNLPLLDNYVKAWRTAAQRHGITAEPDLGAAFRLPGIFAENGSENGKEPSVGMESFLIRLTEDTVAELNRFREREGAETAVAMRERNACIREGVERIKTIRASALPAFHARLRERLGDLLEVVAVEPQRLAQEAAILADRSDVGEEITRLEIHTEQLDQLLRAGGDVGKKLDFLLQEMNRETNTILSKTNGIGEQGLTLTETALAIKAAIEKIREQSLNLE